MTATYTPQGALVVEDNAYRPGASPSLDRQKIFQGGRGYSVSATGKVLAGPGALISIRCITAGTITSLNDSSIAATGDLLLGSSAMTAGQVIKISEPLKFGLWAVVASGTYRVVCTP